VNLLICITYSLIEQHKKHQAGGIRRCYGILCASFSLALEYVFVEGIMIYVSFFRV
jgi:hypothetical protein